MRGFGGAIADLSPEPPLNGGVSRKETTMENEKPVADHVHEHTHTHTHEHRHGDLVHTHEHTHTHSHPHAAHGHDPNEPHMHTHEYQPTTGETAHEKADHEHHH
jgi:hypothetical protein